MVLLQRLKNFVTAWCQKNVQKVRVLEFEEWLATTSYNEARKEELRKVHRNLKGGKPTRKQCERVSSFVKSEGYDTYKHCRLINSRCDAFKVFSGPAFKAIEEQLYKHQAFVKHVPVPDRPALIDSLVNAGRRYFITDFTAFESHFLPDIMEALEFPLYRQALGDWAPLPTLLATLRGVNKLRLRSGLRASCEARRMSGEMNTSLANGFANYMLATFIAHEEGGMLEGFVEGDDGVFATNFELNATHYQRLGFTIKIQEVPHPGLGAFCGMIYAGSGQIIRNPVHFLANFPYTTSCIMGGPKVMLSLLRAKALSALYETPHCPIVWAAARVALQLTRGCLPRYVDDGYHLPIDEMRIPEESSPLADTRVIFHTLFGIPPATQERIEQLILGRSFAAAAALMPRSADPQDGDMSHFALRYVERL